MAALYDINDNSTRFSEDALVQRFEAIYGVGPKPRIACAPGRANVVGEHVDYQGRARCLVFHEEGGLRRFQDVFMNRLQERRPWVVSFSILRPFLTETVPSAQAASRCPSR